MRDFADSAGSRVVAHGAAALAAVAVAPVALWALAVRPAWRVGVRERLGGGPALPRGCIWIHAASVGEVLAASRLIDRLQKAGHRVATSTVTLTGREVMRGRSPEVPCRLAPLDHPWCVSAALDRVQPAALVLVETEIWPSWIAAARRRGIPVVVVSGRVSDRSYPRYRRAGWLLWRTLGRLSAVGARTAVDRDRFVALGADPARVSVIGDLKLDVDAEPRPLPPELRAALAGLPVIVAGSTHPGEEQAALEALARAEAAGMSPALVVAPRHPERAEEVVRRVQGAGRAARRRTALPGSSLRPGDVLVLDTVGELPSLYECADAAFVGGTLVPVGGHNLLEPVFAGRPVLYGPHTANVRHVAELLERAGAGRRVHDARELSLAVVDLLRDPAAARARGERGRLELERHRGSAERAASLIESALGAR